MSTQQTTEQIREMILASLHSKVTTAEKIGAGAREDVQVNNEQYEAQARNFMEAVARQKVGDEIWEVYKRVRDAVDPVQELEDMKDEFTKMVFEYGGRMPSDSAGRAFAEIHHRYMIDATKEFGSLLKAARRHSEK